MTFLVAPVLSSFFRLMRSESQPDRFMVAHMPM